MYYSKARKRLIFSGLNNVFRAIFFPKFFNKIVCTFFILPYKRINSAFVIFSIPVTAHRQHFCVHYRVIIAFKRKYTKRKYTHLCIYIRQTSVKRACIKNITQNGFNLCTPFFYRIMFFLIYNYGF